MGSILTNSAMSFSPHHPFVRQLLESLVQAYSDPDTFAIIGPSLVTSVARNFTGVENILEITPEMGLNVVRWEEWECSEFGIKCAYYFQTKSYFRRGCPQDAAFV